MEGKHNILQVINQCQELEKEINQFQALVNLLKKLWELGGNIIHMDELENAIKNIELSPIRLVKSYRRLEQTIIRST